MTSLMDGLEPKEPQPLVYRPGAVMAFNDPDRCTDPELVAGNLMWPQDPNGTISQLVRLEPGDATRYDFWLIRVLPEMDPKLRSYGLDKDGFWIWFSPINIGKHGVWLDLRTRGFQYPMRDGGSPVYTNEWSEKVVCRYLDWVQYYLATSDI
jgi:hypothetical protein